MASEFETEHLARSILHTLAFFAAQEKAPTLLELRGALVRTDSGQSTPSLSELRDALTAELSDRVIGRNGLYSLQECARHSELRLEKYRRSMALLRKARRWARGLAYVPYVEAAALSGSVAQINAGPESDIDLFIIVRPGRVFLARFLVSVYFQIFGGRRHGGEIAGKFCLNHYVAEGSVLIQDRNLYTAQEYSGLIPVFGEKFLQKFWEDNAGWIGQFVVDPRLPVSAVFGSTALRARAQKIGETLLWPFAGALENFFRFFQKRRIHTSDFVLVSAAELSFHPESKGQQVLSRYRDYLQQAGV